MSSISESLNKNFWEHFNDLKNLLIKLFLVWLVCTCLTLFFSNEIFEVFTSPLGDKTLRALSPIEPVMMLIKIHALTGALIALPFWLYFLWGYLASVLESKEKKFVLFYTLASIFLSTIGIVYAYFSLIPSSIEILTNLAPANIELEITANEYLNFFISIVLILILVFQVPIAVYGLIKTGIVTREMYYQKRKFTYFFVVVAMAVLTPTPDIFTLLLIIVPVLGLLEGAVFLAGFGNNNTVKNLD